MCRGELWLVARYTIESFNGRDGVSVAGYIRFLGVHGSPSKQSRATSLQLSSKTLIDAGNVMELADAAAEIEQVFLTHAHLDPVLDWGLMVDAFYEQRSTPLTVYALPSVLSAVRRHIFNDVIWPDFSRIALLGQTQAALTFVPMVLQHEYEVEPGLVITPVEANHSVDACGFVIEGNGGGCLFSGDTYVNPALWLRLNQNPRIKSVVIDVSFPNRLQSLAQASKHLTPALLLEELKQLQRTDVKIYVFHLKPTYRREIVSELLAMGLTPTAILEDGVCLRLADGALCAD